MKKRLLSILLTVAMLLSLMPAMALTVSAVDSVPYIYYTSDDNTATMHTDKSCENYETVNGSTTSWNAGWYVVSGTVNISGQVTVLGEVNLILCDGATLTVSGGIAAGYSNTLNIYGQIGGTGMLIAGVSGQIDDDKTGIGGSDGTVNIHGGTVTALGGTYAYDEVPIAYGGAGIKGTVTIYGGTVTASGGAGVAEMWASGGSGIDGTVTIYGGTVTAKGGTGSTEGGKSIDGTLTVKDGFKVKMGADESNTEEKDVNDYINSRTTYVKIYIPHDHKFSFAANENVITASCTEPNCDLTGAKVSLTLTEDSLSATGVSLNGAEDWEAFDLAVPEIEYSVRDASNYSTYPPDAAGNYTARIQFPSGGSTYTATQDFSIAAHTVTVLCGSADQTANVMPGTTVTLTALSLVKITDDVSRSFKNWTADGITFDNSTSNSTTFTMPNQDVEVTANYVDCAPFVVSDNGSVTAVPKIIGYSVTAEAKNPPEGKIFLYWTAEGATLTDEQAKTKSLTLDMPASKLVLTAVYGVRSVEIPTADTNSFTYDGTEKTYTLGNTSDSEYYTLSCEDSNVTIDGTNAKASKAGSYTLTATLKDTIRTKWTDDTTQPKTFTFTIDMSQVEIPTADPRSFTYNGAGKIYTFDNTSDSEYYTLSCEDSNVEFYGAMAIASEAGSYTLKATLKDTSKTKWTDGTTEPKTFTFTINPMIIPKPEPDPRSFVADETDKTFYVFYRFGDDCYDYSDVFYTVSGNVQKEAGNHKVAVSPMKNFCWKDGSTTALSFDFNIEKQSVPGFIFYLREHSTGYITNQVDRSGKRSERESTESVIQVTTPIKDCYTPYLLGAPDGTTAVYYIYDETDGKVMLWDNVTLEQLKDTHSYLLYADLSHPDYAPRTTGAVEFYALPYCTRTLAYKKYQISNRKVKVDLAMDNIFLVTNTSLEGPSYRSYDQRMYDFCDVESAIRQIISDLSDCEFVDMLNYQNGRIYEYQKSQINNLRALLPKSIVKGALKAALLGKSDEYVFNQGYINEYMTTMNIDARSKISDGAFENLPFSHLNAERKDESALLNSLLALGDDIGQNPNSTANPTLHVCTLLYDPMGGSEIIENTVNLDLGVYGASVHLRMGGSDNGKYPAYDLTEALPPETKLSGYQFVGVYGGEYSAEKLESDPKMCSLSFGQNLCEWDIQNDTVNLCYDVSEDFDGDTVTNKTKRENTVYVVYMKEGTDDWENTAEISLTTTNGATAVLQLPAIHAKAAYGTVTSANDAYFTIDKTDLANGKLTLKTVKKFEGPLTFTVNVEFEYERETYIAYPITVTVTPHAPSSGGGGSSTITVPISSESSKVNVQATVSGSAATVKEIKDADLAKVTGGESVEIDLSGLGKNVDTAKIPTTTVEKIAEQSGMSVKLSTATVTFDTAATQEIAAQADGSTIQLVVDDVKEVSLNAVQKESVKKLDTALIIDAYLVSNGTKLCTEGKGGFNGGKATVALPFEIKNNRTAANYSVFYVDDAGNLEKLTAKYDTELGAFVFDITHFSNYVVAYDENAMPFVDVANTAYYYDSVKWALSNGITDGIDSTHFNPYGITNRAQMVTFLWRVAGKPEPTITETPFKDLKPDWYYYKAVLWAYENGITDGTTATTFEPNTNVSRAQVVTFLWRYAGKPVVNYFMNMTDVASEKYYTEAVRWALSEKITEGTTNTTFSPNDDCLRGQIVTFLYRDFAK